MKHSLMLQGKEMARKHHIQQIKQKTQRQNEVCKLNEPIQIKFNLIIFHEKLIITDVTA